MVVPDPFVVCGSGTPKKLLCHVQCQIIACQKRFLDAAKVADVLALRLLSVYFLVTRLGHAELGILIDQALFSGLEFLECRYIPPLLLVPDLVKECTLKHESSCRRAWFLLPMLS